MLWEKIVFNEVSLKVLVQITDLQSMNIKEENISEATELSKLPRAIHIHWASYGKHYAKCELVIHVFSIQYISSVTFSCSSFI